MEVADQIVDARVPHAAWKCAGLGEEAGLLVERGVIEGFIAPAAGVGAMEEREHMPPVGVALLRLPARAIGVVGPASPLAGALPLGHGAEPLASALTSSLGLDSADVALRIEA